MSAGASLGRLKRATTPPTQVFNCRKILQQVSQREIWILAESLHGAALKRRQQVGLEHPGPFAPRSLLAQQGPSRSRVELAGADGSLVGEVGVTAPAQEAEEGEIAHAQEAEAGEVEVPAAPPLRLLIAVAELFGVASRLVVLVQQIGELEAEGAGGPLGGLLAGEPIEEFG